MTFDRGEIILVPFPFTDLSAAKRRPVLMLTRPDKYGDFVGLPVTSRGHHVHAVAITGADLLRGALPVASWARTDRVVTLNAGLTVKSVGRVSEAIVERCVQELCTYLGRPGC